MLTSVLGEDTTATVRRPRVPVESAPELAPCGRNGLAPHRIEPVPPCPPIQGCGLAAKSSASASSCLAIWSSGSRISGVVSASCRSSITAVRKNTTVLSLRSIVFRMGDPDRASRRSCSGELAPSEADQRSSAITESVTEGISNEPPNAAAKAAASAWSLKDTRIDWQVPSGENRKLLGSNLSRSSHVRIWFIRSSRSPSATLTSAT
jgi:hypothetical protein